MGRAGGGVTGSIAAGGAQLRLVKAVWQCGSERRNEVEWRIMSDEDGSLLRSIDPKSTSAWCMVLRKLRIHNP